MKSVTVVISDGDYDGMEEHFKSCSPGRPLVAVINYDRDECSASCEDNYCPVHGIAAVKRTATDVSRRG